MISDLSAFSKTDNPYLKAFDISRGSILVDGKPSDHRIRNYEFVKGINVFAKKLDSLGISIIIQHMGPLTRGLPDLQECVSLFKWQRKSCEYHSKSEHLRARKYLDNSLKELSKKNSNLFVFDPIHEVCSDISCSYLSPKGTLLFRDQSHFSDDASAMLADKFLIFLMHI